MTAKKADAPEGHPLDKLREKFTGSQISKLPKETRAQIDARKADKTQMVFNCEVCGGHHHKKAVHLDYVGHAALTDRLLDTDVMWTWEPVAFDANGLPAFDANRGLWIKLTVCGVTRLGYGSADGKQGGDAIKEIIGDAMRNAAMRFGAALDLWHKGDLHADDELETAKPEAAKSEPTVTMSDDIQRDTIIHLAKAADISTLSILDTVNAKATTKVKNLTELTEAQAASIIKKLNKTIEARTAKPADDILDDEIKY